MIIDLGFAREITQGNENTLRMSSVDFTFEPTCTTGPVGFQGLKRLWLVLLLSCGSGAPRDGSVFVLGG